MSLGAYCWVSGIIFPCAIIMPHGMLLSSGAVRVLPIPPVPVGPHGARAPVVELLLLDTEMQVSIAGVEERRWVIA